MAARSCWMMDCLHEMDKTALIIRRIRKRALQKRGPGRTIKRATLERLIRKNGTPFLKDWIVRRARSRPGSRDRREQQRDITDNEN